VGYVVNCHAVSGELVDILASEDRHGTLSCRSWRNGGATASVSGFSCRSGGVEMFANRAEDRSRSMALSGLGVSLSDAQETRRGAVAAASLVFIGVWAVEVMKGVLMGATAFAANYKIFVSAAPVDGVSQSETAGALREEGAGLPASDRDEFPEHTYSGSLHEFEAFACRVVEHEGDG
jgi:allantoicase